MKKVYLFIAASALFFNAQAQNFDWAKREGQSAYDYGYGISTDNSGNVYVAGKYEENADFSGTILPCQGNHDIFLAKYNAAGAISWVRTGGGLNGDYAHALACDGVSSVYTTGEIEGYGNQIIFPGSAITLTCIGDNDVFLCKYDLNGTLLWARSAGGNYSDKGLGVTYDNTGNIYICGYFNDTATFGTTTIISNGGEDIFIAKYNSTGTFQWVKHAGSPGRDEAKSIKCDAAGNVYICGMYSQGCVFGSQTLSTYNNTIYFDAFIAKYSPSGSLIWVKTAGGDYDDVAWSLTTDNAGKVFIAGEYNGYAVFDALSLTTSGRAQAFVACYDASGNAQWATKAGGIMPVYADNMTARARGIGCDGTNILITGQFGATAVFGAISLTAADSSDIFFASLDNNGNFIRAVSVGGAADAFENLGYESGNAICADASGNAYATGSLLDGGVFGSTTLTAYSRTDVFITRISLLTSVNDLANNPKNISVYPNPSTGNFTLDMTQLAGQKTEMTITNCLGQIINKRTDKSSSKMNIDLSAEQKGIYFIEIKSEDQSISRGKIVLQ